MNGSPQIFTEADVRDATTMEMAIESVRRAFIASSEGRANNPLPWNLDLPEQEGEVHVKGAYLEGSDVFVVKASTGFPRNAALGLPTSTGYSSVFDANTGELRALILDNGYLTELRAGAAGGLALDLFAAPDIDTVTVIGTGGQAKFQLDAILAVRTPRRIVVVGRDRERAEALAAWARTHTGVEIVASTDVENAVRESDAVVCVTPSRDPIVQLEWVRPGMHITSVGSDASWKREISPAIVTSASVVAADDVAQSRILGELKGIDDDQLVRPAVSVGAILTGAAVGRRSADELTVADFSGLGIQDATVAEAALAILQAVGVPRVS